MDHLDEMSYHDMVTAAQIDIADRQQDTTNQSILAPLIGSYLLFLNHRLLSPGHKTRMGFWSWVFETILWKSNMLTSGKRSCKGFKHPFIIDHLWITLALPLRQHLRATVFEKERVDSIYHSCVLCDQHFS